MITQADRENYGEEFIDLTRRAAIDALAPELHQLRAENQQLRQAAQRSQNSTIQQALDQALPDWRATYADPEFSAWLQSPDPYAGETRSQLLRRAVAPAMPTGWCVSIKASSERLTMPLPVTRVPPNPVRPQAAATSTPGRKSRTSTSNGAMAASMMQIGPGGRLTSSRPVARAA
jgi:hypothetical protein